MLEATLILLTLLVMCASLLLIMVPAVPVASLQWAILMFFGVLNGFDRVTVTAAIVATLFAAIGSTSQFWMPLFGLKGKGISCMGMIAFFVGMVLGTTLIPIPFLGTILGGVAGVIIVEFARLQVWREAIRSGGTALRLVVMGMIAEFAFAVAIILTFIVSLLTTA